MMARIPVRFNRIAAAFDEAAKALPLRLCESSGSDHSREELTDLSDLVNSFIESHNCGVETHDHEVIEQEKEKDQKDNGSDGYHSDSETKDTLKSLIGTDHNISDDDDDDDVKHKIFEQTKIACGSLFWDLSSEGFKRKLMSHLRDKGFDAGLCKSRWEKSGRHPSGSYEYVDVNVNGSRYIIEVNLGGEFEIARPTTSYSSLIELFPKIFVGKPEELKQIVRLMCRAMRGSLKNREMKMPPWRRNGYVQAKWFGHYKRTINEISAKSNNINVDDDAVATKRSVGFDTTSSALPTVSYNCRDNFGRKAGFKGSYLTAAFNPNGSINV